MDNNSTLTYNTHTESQQVWLNERQAKQYIMMQMLDSLGVFDIKNGRVSIDFNREGQIGNVDIIQHYRQPREEKLQK